MSSEAQVAAPERQSRTGKRPVIVPKGVTVEISGRQFSAKGPKGSVSRTLPKEAKVQREGDQITFTADAVGRNGPRLQGLARALAASAVKGVAEGFERILELVGTGYRCEVKGQTVSLQVGYSHPTTYQLPAEVKGLVNPDSKGTQLVLTSADAASVGQAAASIRAIRPAEPYGGKGIRYRGEQVRRKAGKAGKGRK
jgi:large subunit ribosomal protein L6